MRTILNYSWSDWKVALTAAVILAAAAGLISAWLTPRGPTTTPQALATMAAALLIGAAAGVVTGSRWSMLITPVVFAAVFELARLGVAGPTVDAIHLGSTYGLIAFIVGRLLHAVLALAPMILGARYGVWLAARIGNQTAAALSPVGWGFSGLISLAMIGLAILIARPAAACPIIGPDGEPLPGSVSEIVAIPVGGHEQVLMVRGRSIDNPVLLYLAGGPGGTDLGAMRADAALEQYFVVVTWEQRGVGKSYSALDPTDTLTLDQMIADAVEISNYLRTRFNEDKIYLVGNSWGTLLGGLVVQQHPEFYHAFVGAGQMVSLRETDIMFYEDTLTWAEQTGNSDLAAQLHQNGPPPYADLLDYELALSHEHAWNPYPYLDTGKEMPSNLFVPENSFMDRVNGLRSFLDTFSVLYPQLQGVDFRQDIPSLKVPFVMVIGKYEARGRAVLAREWFEMLDAPTKEMVVFERSGHRTLFEEPAAFAEVMQRVLEATYESK